MDENDREQGVPTGEQRASANADTPGLAADLARACVESRTEQELLEAVLTSVAGSVPGERHALVALLEGGARAQVVALREQGACVVHPPSAGFTTSTMVGWDDVLAGRSASLADLSGSRSGTERSLLSLDLRSAIRVPFPPGTPPAGCVCVGRAEADAFAPEDVRRLERAAGAVDLALRFARMRGDLERMEHAVEERLRHAEAPMVLLDSLTLAVLLANHAFREFANVDGRPAQWTDLLPAPELGAFRRFVHDVRTRGCARGTVHLLRGGQARPCAAIIDGREALYRGQAAFELAITWTDGPPRVSPDEQAAPRLETIADSVPDILWEMNAHGDYTYVSPAVERVLGFPAESWMGRFPILGVAEPADAAAVRRMRDEVRRGHAATGLEWRARTIDGWVTHFSTSWAPVLGPQGDLVGAAGVHRDVSAARLGEQRLRRQEELLRAVVGSVQACLLSVLPDGTIEWANDAAHEAFGPGGEGAPYEAFVLGPGREPDPCPVRAALTLRRPAPAELVACNGRIYSTVAHPVFGLDGEAERVVVLLMDETERREMTARLAEQERYAALGSVAAGVAHHFSNLLSIIQGEAQLAELRPDPNTVPTRLQEIQRCVRQATEHVRRLREYAGEPSTMDDSVRATPAETLAAKAQALLESLGVTLAPGDAALSGSVTCLTQRSVHGSRAQLEQALEAVLLNAVEACRGNGRVEVRIADEGEMILCVVEDTGEGIAPENLERALEPFFTTRGPRRAGLGLSSAFGLVARAGGEIALDSRSGGPTRVALRLRAVTPPAE